jgi:Endonuclease I
LEASKARPYYEADADHTDADRFYQGSTLDEFAALLSQTHRNRPRYQPAKELYPRIDLQPDHTSRSLGTGHSYDPAELIAADFRIAKLRAERLRSAVTDTDHADMETQLERELPYNCEHVVPQSWFNKNEPMRGDLHHLFTCEARATAFAATPHTPNSPTSRMHSSEQSAPMAVRANATVSGLRQGRCGSRGLLLPCPLPGGHQRHRTPPGPPRCAADLA